MSPNSEVHRVYATFNSIEEFTEKAIQAIAGLRRFLDGSAPPVHRPVSEADPIPTSPDFYAEPRYIGSHKFVGRRGRRCRPASRHFLRCDWRLGQEHAHLGVGDKSRSQDSR